MNSNQAIKLLNTLANGTDPLTGETFSADSPYQQPEIVRALFYAVRVLEGTAAGPNAANRTVNANPAGSSVRETAARSAGRPANSGKPWTKDEDEALLAAYDTGQTIEDLARAHARSRLGVEARLAKFGRVPMPVGVRAREGRDEEAGHPAPMADGDGYHAGAFQVREAARPIYQARI